jgi:hypothetical protein
MGVGGGPALITEGHGTHWSSLRTSHTLGQWDDLVAGIPGQVWQDGLAPLIHRLAYFANMTF